MNGVGALTISKMNGDHDYVVVAVRTSEGTIRVELSLEDFSKTLFGLSETPCNITLRTGRNNSINIRESTQ